MSDNSKIEWTDATWNPVAGCARVSEGCRNCYAENMAARFNKPGQWGHGMAERVTRPDGTSEARWTGKVALLDHKLDLPLRWRRPRRIFVNATSDLFHEAVPDAFIDRVFAVMALASQHRFQILTKRPARMREYLAVRNETKPDCPITQAAFWMMKPRGYRGSGGLAARPLPNVWLGVSVEDQGTADARIPLLLETPAAVRFISAEPLLGPVDLELIEYYPGFFFNVLTGESQDGCCPDGPGINWVICGGESGPNARPMNPDWARSLRDQCASSGVPFFFKQWGEWGPEMLSSVRDSYWWPWLNTKQHGPISFQVGKARAGRLLDGVEHNAMPGMGY